MIRGSQWPRVLRRRSTAARLMGLWVRIPPGAWMPLCVECCVLSGRGLCDELITPLEESYRLWCVVVCDLGTSRMRRPWPVLGHSSTAGGGRVDVDGTESCLLLLSALLLAALSYLTGGGASIPQPVSSPSYTALKRKIYNLLKPKILESSFSVQ